MHPRWERLARTCDAYRQMTEATHTEALRHAAERDAEAAVRAAMATMESERTS